MKTILFCNLPYAFSILKPLADELEKRGYDYIWYVSPFLTDIFPYKNMPITDKIKVLEAFQSDAIFVPGNDIPYWLRGLKVQIFHGLAGEKKGHFRIRDYFTNKFNTLAKRHKNFEVKETGWCKLDKLYTISNETQAKKKQLLLRYNVQHIILYAPTFSPSLTSALKLKKSIETFANNENLLVIIKFHDKMDTKIIAQYKALDSKNLLIIDDNDITQSLQIADLMSSDSSSVVYEFILLDKPVVTLNSISENIDWLNLHSTDTFCLKVLEILDGDDKYKEKRKNTIALYHPYSDGKSSKRMIDATEAYLKEHEVPKKRKVSILRKWKLYKKYRT